MLRSKNDLATAAMGLYAPAASDRALHQAFRGPNNLNVLKRGQGAQRFRREAGDGRKREE